MSRRRNGLRFYLVDVGIVALLLLVGFLGWLGTWALASVLLHHYWWRTAAGVAALGIAWGIVAPGVSAFVIWQRHKILRSRFRYEPVTR